MKLSQLEMVFKDIKLKNDAEFYHLSMGTSRIIENKSLAFLTDLKYADILLSNNLFSAIITTEEIANHLYGLTNKGILVSKNPRVDFYQIHNWMVDSGFYGKYSSNVIDESSVIGDNVFIDSVGVQIGKKCIVEPGVIIHRGTVIGNNVIIRSGSIIGGEAFQFLNIGNMILPVKSAGGVKINDYVEIQSNTCIVRGAFDGYTVIDEYVKIDNLVHVAHDVYIGPRTLVTAGVIFGGRVYVGEDSWFGINSTIRNGITIGKNVTVSMGAVVTRDVPDGAEVTGNFAIDHSKFLEFIKTIR